MVERIDVWREGYYSSKHSGWFVKVGDGREAFVDAGSKQRDYVQAYIDGYLAGRSDYGAKKVDIAPPKKVAALA